jgi:hypothetical protein
MNILKVQFLIYFQKWTQINIHHVLKLNEKELAEMFLRHLESEELKKDEEYKQNFRR